MAAKKLPLAESPIRGYMMYSYHLAITFAHAEAWPWFFTNHVQLQCEPAQLEFDDFMLDSTAPKGEVHFSEGTWKFNPWLNDSHQMDKAAMASAASSVARYIVDRLDNGFYVETFVDEYHIPSLFNGKESHLRHRMLIFGYDDHKQTFNIIGFDKNRLYRELECRFDEFERAFEAVEPLKHETTKLFKSPPQGLPVVEFDAARFAQLTADYLDSRNTLLDPDLHGKQLKGQEFWFGLKTYQFLQQYVETIMEKNRAGGHLGVDIRGFNIMWEHKKCMLDRMKWVRERGICISDALIERYAEVLSLIEMARNRVVMCGIGLLPRGKGYLAEVPHHLGEACKIEADVLGDMLAGAFGTSVNSGAT